MPIANPLPRWSFLLLICLLLSGCRTPRDPGTVVMLIESSPISLDPRIGTDSQSERIGELIFDSLLRRDRNSNLQPALAEQWEILDPLTYQFRIRSGVRFHDGKPLTARDVRYTFESLLSGEIKSLKTSAFSRIASVEAPDDATLLIRLTEPYASFPWNLTQGAMGIVPEGASPDLGSNPIGSGPFRFVRAVQDEEVVLERNSEYWGRAPQIERVRFRVVPDATTRALELRNGSADIVLNALTADTVESLRGEPSLQVTQEVGNTYQYLALNLANPELTNPVRRAIAHAIDRDELIHYLWRDLVRPADSILPSNHWAHAPDLPDFPYDPEKARELLDQAGLPPGPDGTRLHLVMKTSTDQTGRELASVLQNQLSRIGIALEIRSYEFATFYGDIVRGDFDIYSLRWIGGNDDPDIYEYVFHSDNTPPSGANRGHYANPLADELIGQGRNGVDQPSRIAAYRQLQHLLNADLPYIHLWYSDNVVVHHRRIGNIHIFPSGNYDFLTEVQMQ